MTKEQRITINGKEYVIDLYKLHLEWAYHDWLNQRWWERKGAPTAQEFAEWREQYDRKYNTGHSQEDQG